MLSTLMQFSISFEEILDGAKCEREYLLEKEKYENEKEFLRKQEEFRKNVLCVKGIIGFKKINLENMEENFNYWSEENKQRKIKSKADYNLKMEQDKILDNKVLELKDKIIDFNYRAKYYKKELERICPHRNTEIKKKPNMETFNGRIYFLPDKDIIFCLDCEKIIN